MGIKSEGIWIPKELANNPELDWIDRILLSEIQQLSKLELGCIISNNSLGELCEIHSGNVSKRLSRLSSLEYIKIILTKKDKKKTLRKIIPTYKGVSVNATTTKRERTKDYASTHEGVSVNATTTTRERSTTDSFNIPINKSLNTHSISPADLEFADSFIDNYLTKKKI